MPCRKTFARGPTRPGRRSRRGPARAAKRFSQASCNRIWAGLGFPFGASSGRLGSLFTDPETLVKQRRRMGNSQPNGPKYCLVRPNRKPTSTPPAVAPAVATAVPPAVAPAVATARSSAARSATSRSSAAATRSAAEPPLDPPPEPPLPEPPPPDPALVLPALATPPVGPPPLGPPLVLRNAVEFLGASPKSAKRIGGKLGAARLFACRLA